MKMSKLGKVKLNLFCFRNLIGIKDESTVEKEEELEYLQLHRTVVKKIGEICRVVNQVIVNVRLKIVLHFGIVILAWG